MPEQDGYEFDCGCGLNAQEIRSLLGTSPVQPKDWRQVSSHGEVCRTCGGHQKFLFMRQKPNGGKQ